MQLAQHRSFHMFIHNNFETMYYHTVKAFVRYNRQLFVLDHL